MNQLIQVVDTIRTIVGAQVDCHFGQGSEALLRHLQMPNEEAAVHVDPELTATLGRGALTELQALVAPYQVPADYEFFLWFYGGLEIDKPNYRISVLGIGPMTNEWYFDLLGDDGYYENGLLLIGRLVFDDDRPHPYVHFLLDVAGKVNPGCIIGVQDEGVFATPFGDNVAALTSWGKRWTKLTDSFVEWLTLVAETTGTCGYY